MKILLTGHKGFVGNHVLLALEKQHEVFILERQPTFREWYEQMRALMMNGINAVVHIGAVAENQTQDPSIFLWNSHGTYLLAEEVARKQQRFQRQIPFIYFSSNLVGETEDDWDKRSAYTWSKAVAEDYVRTLLPRATILRPATIWGNGEERKKHKHRSAPYQLAAHELKYLFRNYNRYYVHVSDIVEAVRVSLKTRPSGAFSLYEPRNLSTQDLLAYTDYRGFEWIDDPHEYGYYDILPDMALPAAPLLPNWKARTTVEAGMPALEKELHD